MSTWTKDCQRSLVEIATLSNVLSIHRVCSLHQPAMSSTNVATLTDKMEKFWVFAWDGVGGFQTWIGLVWGCQHV